MISNINLISSRYAYDGLAHPDIKMNGLQKEMIRVITFKVNTSHYRFEYINCCVCGENIFDVLSFKDRYGLYMPVGCCHKCGLIQTVPRMSQVSYEEFYNLEYRRLYGGSHSPVESFFIDQYHRGKIICGYLNSFFSKYKGQDIVGFKILEVGCGAGGICQALKELGGCFVKGIDIGKEYIDYGRERYGLDLIDGKLSTDIDPYNNFDIVVYSHVFEHLLNFHSELNAIKKILKEDGLLYIEVPGIFNIAHSYKSDFLLYLQNAHTYHFTLSSLINLMKVNGFECIAGDEFIRSIFRPSKNQSHEVILKNNYPYVINFLKKIESEKRG